MLHLIFTSEAAARAYHKHRDEIQTKRSGGKHRFPERPEDFKRGAKAPPPACSEHYETLDKDPKSNTWRLRVNAEAQEFSDDIAANGHRFDISAAVEDKDLPDAFKPPPPTITP